MHLGTEPCTQVTVVSSDGMIAAVDTETNQKLSVLESNQVKWAFHQHLIWPTSVSGLPLYLTHPT